MPDRSLDEFATAESDGDEGDDTGATGTDGDADPTPESDADAASAPESDTAPTVTMQWSPDGAACDACSETVTRRWRDDERFVCADCKEW